MRVFPPLLVALLALPPGTAWPQQVAPGSLPPPRPLNAPPSAPAPSQAPAPAPPSRATTPVPPQASPATRPPQPRASQPAPAARSAPASRPMQAPAAQPRATRPPAQPPTVGNRTPPQNRRPGAAAGAAAGGAAGAAAAGAASAASRAPEPPTPAVPAPPPAPSVGPVSGFPLPRFASLRSDQVNMRVGPNTTFPIEWTFQRRDLPVMIIGEFQVWRRIRDVDGAEGWVHQSTLQGRRTVLVRPPGTGQEITLRRDPAADAGAAARLRPGVIARIRECESASAWCEVQVGSHRGWLRRSDVWGLLPDEEVK